MRRPVKTLFHQNRAAVVISLLVVSASGSTLLRLESAEAVSARLAVCLGDLFLARRFARLRSARAHATILASGLCRFRPNLAVPQGLPNRPHFLRARKAAWMRCERTRRRLALSFGSHGLEGPSCVTELRFGLKGDAAGAGDVFLLTNTFALGRWVPCLRWTLWCDSCQL